jgi:hypothetical protein
VLIIISIAFAGYSLGRSQRSDKKESKKQEVTRPVLTEQFFHKTVVGQSILNYLKCVDFDCAEAHRKLVKIGHDAVSPLVEILQKGLPSSIATQLPSGDRRLVQLRIMSALGDLGDEQAMPSLVAMLQESSPLVRAGSVDALGQLGGDRTLQSLLPLLADPDELVRERTATALARINRVEALPSLRKAAEAESKPHVRAAMNAAIQSIQRKQ